METVIFEANWQAFFKRHGLERFDDFFTCQQGDAINQNTKRNVLMMTFSDGGADNHFFMKRFFNPHFKDMLFTLSNFGRLCSQAELEWRNAHILLENGIETYHPVCYGFRSVCGIERQSFFITEKINGECLLDYLLRQWETLDRSHREALIVKLGRFFQRIHAAGLSLPDSYIWHVYMVNTATGYDDYEFGMIDLHRMRIRTRGSAQAAMNLGRFLFSLPKGLMDAELQSIFIDSYLTKAPDVERRDFIGQIHHWKHKLLKRRRKKITSLGPTSTNIEPK